MGELFVMNGALAKAQPIAFEESKNSLLLDDSSIYNIMLDVVKSSTYWIMLDEINIHAFDSMEGISSDEVLKNCLLGQRDYLRVYTSIHRLKIPEHESTREYRTFYEQLKADLTSSVELARE